MKEQQDANWMNNFKKGARGQARQFLIYFQRGGVGGWGAERAIVELEGERLNI